MRTKGKPFWLLTRSTFYRGKKCDLWTGTKVHLVVVVGWYIFVMDSLDFPCFPLRISKHIFFCKPQNFVNPKYNLQGDCFYMAFLWKKKYIYTFSLSFYSFSFYEIIYFTSEFCISSSYVYDWWCSMKFTKPFFIGNLQIILQITEL